MTSTKIRFLTVLPLLLLLFSGTVAWGQGAEANPSPLADEILGIEKRLANNPLTAVERREAYVRLARIQRLAGDVEASARAWREAALADPANRDDRCMLESGLCYLALGEFDAAQDALRGIIAGAPGAESAVQRDAQYVGAQIEVFRAGNTAPLYALLSKPEFAAYRPAIYYTFWRIFGDGAYRARILSEFPDSPEARILQSEEALAANPAPGAAPPGIGAAPGVDAAPGGVQVSAMNRPLWFLFPGRGNVAIGAPVTLAAPQPTLPAAASSAPEAGPKGLQTGLFGKEENAQAMVSRLGAKGFSASVSQRPVNGATYWAVTVPPGPNSGQTILRLKDAGFEAFPIF